MKQLIFPILLGVVLTICFYSIGIFYSGAELLLLPFIIGLFLIGLAGFYTIPIGLYQILKKQDVNRWLKRSIGLALGFYLGLLLQNPVSNWDHQQRNLSGQIISAELEEFKQENGKYPKDFSLLDVDKLNKLLPNTYQVDKFNYRTSSGTDYDLDIPIPITDRWHWNKETKEFEFNG